MSDKKRRRGEGLPDWNAPSRTLFDALYPAEPEWAEIYEDAMAKYDRRLGVEATWFIPRVRRSRQERETSVWADVRYFQRVLALEYPGHRGEYLEKALRLVASEHYDRSSEPTPAQIAKVRRLHRNARSSRTKNGP